MEAIIWIGIMYVLPCYIAYKIAQDRNRTPWKAVLATIICGWLAVLFIALFLKKKCENEK